MPVQVRPRAVRGAMPELLQRGRDDKNRLPVADQGLADEDDFHRLDRCVPRFRQIGQPDFKRYIDVPVAVPVTCQGSLVPSQPRTKINKRKTVRLMWNYPATVKVWTSIPA